MNEPTQNKKLNGKELIEDMCKNWKSYVSDEYIREIKELCDSKVNMFIFNDSIAHAVYLTHLLIDKSKDSIKLYSDMLDEIFYDYVDISNAFDKAVKDRGVKVEILLQNVVQKERFPRKLHDSWSKYGDRVKIYKAIEPRYVNHFLISDATAYRFEEVHSKEEFIKGEVKATVNFNDPNIAKVLENNFLSIDKKELSFDDTE